MQAVNEALVDVLPAAEQRRGTLHSCPQCGSFLDAPRIHPPSGDLARKCASCREWYRVAREGSARD